MCLGDRKNIVLPTSMTFSSILEFGKNIYSILRSVDGEPDLWSIWVT